MRKKCSSDQGKLLKFEAGGREFELEQLYVIKIVKNNLDLEKCRKRIKDLCNLQPCPFGSGLRKFALDPVIVIFFKNAKKIEITRTFFSNSERSEQFLKQNVFLFTYSWKIIKSKKFE